MGTALQRAMGEDRGFRSFDGEAPVDSLENRRLMARFAIFMAGTYLVLGNVVLLVVRIHDPDMDGLDLGRAQLVSAGFTIVMVPAVYVAFMRLPLLLVHLLVPVATAMVVVEGFAIGPFATEAVAVAMVIITIVVSVATTRVATFLHLVHVGAGYLVVVSFQDGHPNPGGRFVGIFGGVVVIGIAVGRLVDRSRQHAVAALAASEAAQAARLELAELNHTLEERVRVQVADLERMGELQRFLPAPVVDAVLSGSPELLEPHRGEIAVLCCDLRGFGALASGAQPEEVHELLDAYFALLGRHAQHHRATVGAFTGDGLMAFFNDPLPVPDPACRAVQLALDLQGPVHDLLAGWRRVGHDVGFGVGIALGYANIGMVGFEGRRDYTALGPVVSLAAGLCAEAPSGAILLDKRAGLAVEGHLPLGEPYDVGIRGFDLLVEAVPVRCPMSS